MAGKITRTLEERFWEKVRKTPGCWIWLTNKNKKGYGRIWMNGRNHFAQRIAFLMTFGPFDQQKRILHKCDNPSCVRPSHLFIGTDADNGADKARKGRAAKGDKNGNSKLTPHDVLEIRAAKGTLREIGERFNIDRSQVFNIKKRKQWAHI